jgi:hypothetical protein
MATVPGTTPLTYDSYIDAVSKLAVINLQTISGSTSTIDPNFGNIIPQMINYAELRIQRDLDLLPLQTTAQYALISGVGFFTIPMNDFVTVQNIGIQDTLGKRSILTPVSKEFLQNVYPSDDTGRPKFFCASGGSGPSTGPTDMAYTIKPAPDQAYTVYVTGTTRMPTLNQYAGSSLSSTGTTFISVFLPDLFIMASMIFVSGYQRNFSANSDDPNMAVNYEKQYQTLLKGAMVEEARKRFRASAWSPEAPAPVATPVRA